MMKREDVQKFSELDAEIRIRLIMDYISMLRNGLRDNGKLLENTDTNVAIKKAFELLQKEFEA